MEKDAQIRIAIVMTLVMAIVVPAFLLSTTQMPDAAYLSLFYEAIYVTCIVVLIKYKSDKEQRLYYKYLYNIIIIKKLLNNKNKKCICRLPKINLKIARRRDEQNDKNQTHMFIALLILSSMIVTSANVDASSSNEIDVSIDYNEIKIEELNDALALLNSDGIQLSTDAEGNTTAELIHTLDDGRFGKDKISDTHYIIYLDSLTTGIIVGGGASVVGAAIGTLIAPIVGTTVGAVIGSAIGVAVGAAISEYGIDYSKGIAMDLYFNNAVIVFGVMLYPGAPMVVNVRPQ